MFYPNPEKSYVLTGDKREPKEITNQIFYDRINGLFIVLSQCSYFANLLAHLQYLNQKKKSAVSPILNQIHDKLSNTRSCTTLLFGACAPFGHIFRLAINDVENLEGHQSDAQLDDFKEINP